MEIRALTIRQPWAGLIVAGRKTTENRSWRTVYRGPLLIHAGRALDLDAPALDEPVTFGAIVGVVDLVDIIDDCDSPWAEPACWHWQLANARPVPEPIPACGSLRLWRPTPAVISAIYAQLGNDTGTARQSHAGG